MTDQSNEIDYSGDTDWSHRPNERRSRLLDIIRLSGRASVEDLAVQLQISRETIRRDLAHLDVAGLIRKIHGGAELPSRETGREGPFRERMLENIAAKRAIAKAAAGLFAAGDTLFVDCGSTTVHFAEALTVQQGLTLVTNSVTVAAIAARENHHVVHLIGGQYHEPTSSSLGSAACQAARLFTPDHAVLTIGAIDEFGIYDFDAEEAEMARVMVEQARRITILFDDSKVGRTGLHPVASLKRIDTLVTNRPLPAPLMARIDANGSRVVVARKA